MYPPLSPIIFQVGPFSLYWYGLIMVVAIVIAAWIASRYVSRHGQESNTIWDMLLWVLIPALIGERLYYVFIQSPRGPNGSASGRPASELPWAARVADCVRQRAGWTGIR